MHSRKCAGSSMEVMLNKYLGPDDIQIGSWSETIHAGGKMNKRAVKDAFFSCSSLAHIFSGVCINVLREKKLNISIVVNASIKRRYKDALGDNPACPTAEAVMKFDPKAWGDYFKFSFVRNPFDFEVSDYFWRTRGIYGRLDFKEFLRRKLDAKIEDFEKIVPTPSTNWPIYTVNNELALDFVGRFEELDKDIQYIGEKIGLPLDLKNTPKAKSGIRKSIKSSDFYDEESKNMVAALHNLELDFFGYRYPF